MKTRSLAKLVVAVADALCWALIAFAVGYFGGALLVAAQNGRLVIR